ncbi:MAG: CHASE2 domain-containing protein [Alphaproteobacteria bacterium]|nr:CHASE2 domain-containing protein [Alphaproteobacteria bacterium]
MARFLNKSFILSLLAAVAFTTIVAFFLPYWMPPIRALEYAVEDWRAALLRAPEPQSRDVVVVAADAETFETLPYKTPVDRALLARAVANIAAARPRAIGIAQTFTGPTEPDKDAALQQVLRKTAVPLVIATPGADTPLTATQRKFTREFTDQLITGTDTLGIDSADGTVRWSHPGEDLNGKWHPGFAAALAGRAGVKPSTYIIRLAFHGVPNENTLPFLTIPLHTAAGLPPKWFAGKVVLIGVDDPTARIHRVAGSGDNGQLSDLTIQAHATAQLLAGRAAAVPTELSALLAIFFFASAASALATLRFRTPVRLALGGGGLTALIIADVGLAWTTGIAVPVLMPALAFAASYAQTNAAVRRFTRSRRDYLRDRFSERTSDDLVRQLVASPERAGLEGAQHAVTVVISNLNDFSQLADNLRPEELISVLNGYLEGLCGIVAEHDGIVDRINTDSVVAVFGAPLERPDHGSRAVRCALAMDEFALSYRERRVTNIGKMGHTRFGIHTGNAITGNFGGKAVFAYGAIGQTVSLAGRLERANKALGTRICISVEAARAASDIIVRPIGSLRWDDGDAQVDIFEPLSEAASDTPQVEAYIRAYRMVMQDDPEAPAELARAAKIAPADPLPKLYQFRLSQGKAGTTIVLKA